MKISEFSSYLQKLDDTTKRLEITSILADLIKSLDDDEVDNGIYMALGYLKAVYETPKFNIADKMMLRILETALDIKRDDVDAVYAKTGDLGDTAFEVLKRSGAEKKSSHLTVNEVHKALVEIAEIEGAGSQDSKVKKTSELLAKLDTTSVKYIVRIILGTTRLGFTELTVIAALSELLGKAKELTEKIEATYSIHPDIGIIVKNIKKHGMKGIEKIEMETGVPILAQRCQRLASPEEVIEKMGKVWAEFKFDGTRVQLHLDREKAGKSTSIDQTSLFTRGEEKIFVKTFTRNLEETTHQYPDIVSAAIEQIDANSVILDGEAIGYDKKTGEFLPFQEIMQRKRKHNVADFAKDIPLKYFLFDILLLNGKSIVDLPMTKRREILSKVIKKGIVLEPDSYLETDNETDLEEYFQESKDKNLEGLVIKKPDSPYQAGARAFTWVKLKKAQEKLLDDTVDCVVLGYSFGKGQRTQFGIGQFVVGVYDEKTDTFKTITKVGTGLKEEDFIHLKREADKIKVNGKPANVEIDKIFTPDVWVAPKIVVEIGADEISVSEKHTAGYALRFPRLIKFRPDKKATDATTVKEINDLHKLQKRGYYNE